MRIKRSLQRGPKYPKKGKNLRSKAKNRKTKTQRTGNNGPPPPVATTARGGSHGQAVVSPTTVVEPFSPVVRFSLRVPLRLPAVFALFSLYICHVSGPMTTPNSLHSNHLLHFHSFRLVLERERGSGEELRGFHTGLRSKDGNALFG